MSELIYKSDARHAMLTADPASAYLIDRIKPVDTTTLNEATLVERIVDHAFPSHKVFECSICDARNEQFHNFCCICGAKFKEIVYARNGCKP